MTKLQNTFEGYPAVNTAITVANSGGASGDAFASVSSAPTPTGTGSRFSFGTAVMHGTRSMRCNGSTGSPSFFTPSVKLSTDTATGGRGTARFYFLTGALPNSQTTFASYSAASGNTLNVRLNATNRIEIFLGASTIVWTSTNPVTANTWYRIEIGVTNGTGSAVIDFAYYLGDGSTAIQSTSITGQTLNVHVLGCSIGVITSGRTTATYTFDDFAVSDEVASGFIGVPSSSYPVSGTTQIVSDTALTVAERSPASPNAVGVVTTTALTVAERGPAAFTPTPIVAATSLTVAERGPATFTPTAAVVGTSLTLGPTRRRATPDPVEVVTATSAAAGKLFPVAGTTSVETGSSLSAGRALAVAGSVSISSASSLDAVVVSSISLEPVAVVSDSSATVAAILRTAPVYGLDTFEDRDLFASGGNGALNLVFGEGRDGRATSVSNSSAGHRNYFPGNHAGRARTVGDTFELWVNLDNVVTPVLGGIMLASLGEGTIYQMLIDPRNGSAPGSSVSAMQIRTNGAGAGVASTGTSKPIQYNTWFRVTVTIEPDDVLRMRVFTEDGEQIGELSSPRAFTVPFVIGPYGYSRVRFQDIGSPVRASSATALDALPDLRVAGVVEVVTTTSLTPGDRLLAATPEPVTASSGTSLAVTARRPLVPTAAPIVSTTTAATTARRPAAGALAVVSGTSAVVAARRPVEAVTEAYSASALSVAALFPVSGSTPILSTTDAAVAARLPVVLDAVTVVSSTSLAATPPDSVAGTVTIISTTSLEVGLRAAISGSVDVVSASAATVAARRPAAGAVAVVSTTTATVRARRRAAFGPVPIVTGSTLTVAAALVSDLAPVVVVSSISLNLGSFLTVEGVVVIMSSTSADARGLRPVSGALAIVSATSSPAARLRRPISGQAAITSGGSLDVLALLAAELDPTEILTTTEASAEVVEASDIAAYVGDQAVTGARLGDAEVVAVLVG